MSPKTGARFTCIADLAGQTKVLNYRRVKARYSVNVEVALGTDVTTQSNYEREGSFGRK